MCRVTCSITGHFTPATTGHSTPNKDTTPTAVGPLTPNSTVHLAWGTAAAADDHISHEGLAELLLIGGIEPNLDQLKKKRTGQSTTEYHCRLMCDCQKFRNTKLPAALQTHGTIPNSTSESSGSALRQH